MIGQLLTAKVAAIVAGAVISVGGVAAAETGSLPAPAQNVMSDAAFHVGVNVPDSKGAKPVDSKRADGAPAKHEEQHATSPIAAKHEELRITSVSSDEPQHPGMASPEARSAIGEQHRREGESARHEQEPRHDKSGAHGVTTTTVIAHHEESHASTTTTAAPHHETPHPTTTTLVPPHETTTTVVHH